MYTFWKFLNDFGKFRILKIRPTELPAFAENLLTGALFYAHVCTKHYSMEKKGLNSMGSLGSTCDYSFD